MAEQIAVQCGTRLRLGDRLRLLSGARFDLMMRIRRAGDKNTCCPAKCLAFLYALVDSSDADGRTSLRLIDIAERCQCGERAAIKISQILEDEGVIAIERRSPRGIPRGEPINQYAVAWQRMEDLCALNPDDVPPGVDLEDVHDDDGTGASAGDRLPKVSRRRSGSDGNWGAAMESLRSIRQRRPRDEQRQYVDSFADIAEAMAATGCAAPTSVEDADPSIIMRIVVPGWQVLVEASDERGAAILSVFRDDGEDRRG